MRFPLTSEKLRKCQELVEALSTKEKEVAAYDALLEAAISAGRAVPWVLRREIAVNVPTLLPWYEARAQEMGLPRNSAVIWLRNARNLSTRPEPLKAEIPAYSRDMHIMEPPPGAAFAVTNQGEAAWITRDAQGGETRREPSEFDNDAAIKHRIVRPEPPHPLLLEGRDVSGLDATAVLREYGGFLRRLVQAAESAKA
jgi:hypothetical protein